MSLRLALPMAREMRCLPAPALFHWFGNLETQVQESLQQHSVTCPSLSVKGPLPEKAAETCGLLALSHVRSTPGE